MKKCFLLLTVFLSFRAFSQIPPFQWAYGDGGSGTESVKAIRVDKYGFVYVCGQFGSTTDMNPGSGTNNISATSVNCFVAKYTPQNSFLWVKSWGGTGYDFLSDMALDSAGNIYLAGSFENTVDFDPGSGTYTQVSTGLADAYLLKLNNSGAFQWVRTFGDNVKDDELNAVAVDAGNKICVAGNFTGSADFDPGSGVLNVTTGTNTKEILLAQYDASGQPQWAFALTGSTGDDAGFGISTDSSGNIYVTGNFFGTIDFDPGASATNLAATASDFFIARYNNLGQFGWAKGMGSTGADYGLAIDQVPSGKIAVAGYYAQSTDFDPGAGTFTLSGGIRNGFVGIYDTSGSFVHAWDIGTTTYYDEAADIKSDDSGYVYVCGYFTSAVDFDPGSGTTTLNSGSTTYYNAFNAKYDVSGNLSWAFDIGASSDNDRAYAIFVDDSLNVYSGGAFATAADFDPGAAAYTITANSTGTSDLFWAKYGNSPCFNLPGSQLLSICQGSSITVGSNTYNSAGTYLDVLAAAAFNGCDSLLTTVLGIIPLDTSVIVADPYITANQNGASYQWIDCGTMQLLPDTAQSIIAPASGNYAVIVTTALCSDTSACHYVSNPLGIKEERLMLMEIQPNPVLQNMQIRFSRPVNGQISVYDVSGKLWMSSCITSGTDKMIDVTELPAGYYFLRFTGDEFTAVKRFARTNQP